MYTVRFTVLTAVISLTALTAGSSVAHADRRSFTHTYEYPTLAEGELELEFWNTQSGDFGDDGASALGLEIEIEYGITNKWEIALYQTFAQARDATGLDTGLGYGKTKLETRYRLGERGQWPIDVTLYGEVAKPFGVAEYELEPKLILARDLGKITVATNLIAEIEVGDETEFKPGLAAGVTYEVSPGLKVGAELKGELEEEVDAMTGEEEYELEMLAGPAIGWSPSPRLWLASTLGFGVSHAPDLQWRIVVGLGF